MRIKNNRDWLFFYTCTFTLIIRDLTQMRAKRCRDRLYERSQSGGAKKLNVKSILVRRSSNDERNVCKSVI